jgi:transglutaminase-like putative cysteine protease
MIAGDLKYPVSKIPDELKQNVDVVVREDHMSFKIKSQNSATHHVHEVLTILNERGNNLAQRIIFYDKLTKIVDVNAYVYDASGKQIKRLKKSEIYDQAVFDGVSLFSDDRLKEMDLRQAIYPYTVEFEYELDYNFLYYIPSSWWGGERISHEHASYQLVFPEGLEPLYKLFNIQSEPVRKIDKGFESITWDFKNLKPNKIESFGPPIAEIIPHILAVPVEFEYSGYAGRQDNWQNFGKWQIELNKGRDILSEKTIQMAQDLTKSLSSTEAKAKVLYEYLQSRTRYVGIQLGIGGYQPFEAKVVDEVGYGDCKALSNYMVALLKAVGIKGYYTWIYGGTENRELVDGLTYGVFNHIVVSIPNGKDTLWLECTSQTNPFGYQGKFTGDRKALMITDQGGVMVNTLRYTPEQNLQSRTAYVSIDGLGNATAKVKTTSTGIRYENKGLNWTFSSTDKQKKWIEENTEIPNFNINSFSVAEKKDKIPSAIVNLDLTLNKYASVSGKRLFMSPNLMNKNSSVPERSTERKTDVIRKTNFVDLDTIIYTIPENLYPEFIPQPVKIDSKFGQYEANFKFDAGKIIYTRKLKMWKARFPKETYNDLVDFYKGVSKADNIKLVFLNKT